MFKIQKNDSGAVFKVFVQPRSSKNIVAGVHGDALKVKLKAPPVEGAANKMCIQFLAKCLKVPKSSIEILSGHGSRTKRLLVKFGDPESADTKAFEQLKRSILSLAGIAKTP